VTWNCRIGGFRHKSQHIAPLLPDVLAAQEVEPLDRVLLFAGECQPAFRDRIPHPIYPGRGIGVFPRTIEEKEHQGSSLHPLERVE
jgi:hypothetical protein